LSVKKSSKRIKKAKPRRKRKGKRSKDICMLKKMGEQTIETTNKAADTTTQ
jgi:hypothetical protein